MTVKEAIDILERHQEWRRDGNVPPSAPMQDPFRIGEALDTLIALAKGMGAQGAARRGMVNLDPDIVEAVNENFMDLL